MDKKNPDKFIYSYTTINNIIGYLEKVELNSLKAIMKKKFNNSVVCLLQLYEIDKELVVSGSCDSTMKVWKIEKDQCVKTLTGHKGGVRCMVWIKDINIHYVLSGSDDSNIKIWNIDEGKCLNTLSGHKDAVNSLIYLNDIDKNIVVSGSKDSNVKMWNVNSGTCIKTLEGHRSSITGLLYHKPDNGNMLLSFSRDQTMRVWNIQNKELNINNIKSVEIGIINGAVSFTSNKIITCSDDNKVKIWCINKLEKIKSFSEHKGPVKCILAIPEIDPNIFVTGSEDKTIRIWTLKFKEERAEVIINTINVITCYPLSMVYLKNYEIKTIATGNNDGSIQLIKI